jgi:PTH1 family peptidyl-tRNA hydrolase
MPSTLLIAGLGNPGARYERTRHNAGFWVADELARRYSGAWREKFTGLVAKVPHAGVELVLLKPQTFMNVSAQAVQPALQFFGLSAAQLVVVHDDLDLPLGKVRVKVGGGHGGHNGLRSITGAIGSDYIRVRCGIGRPEKGDVSAFVLSPFAKDEIPFVEAMVSRATDAVELVASKGAADAMNKFNGD